MAKNKYDFIKEILENKRLKPAYRERVLMLAKSEIEKDGTKGEELEERVRNLERIFYVDRNKQEVEENFNLDSPFIQISHLSQVNTHNLSKDYNVDRKEQEVEEESDKNVSFIPKAYLNPADTYNFLKDYNNDMILKSTCHLVDRGEMETINSICEIENYDFKSHHQKIIEHYEKLKTRYSKKFIDYKVKKLIETYLKGDGKWNGTIELNWNSKELIKWSNNHPSIPPSLDRSLFQEMKSIGFEIKEFKPIFKLIDKSKLQTFSDIVQHFKYLLHIRSDNSITKLCQLINKKHGDAIAFDYSKIDTRIELFTNVEKILQTYERLIDLVKEVADAHNLDKPQINLSFYSEDEKTVIFSIHHLNTTYEHTLEDAIERPGQVYKNLINNQLNGVCEFSIDADFGDNQFANIIIWDYEVWKTKKLYYKRIDNVVGVKYILKFKK